MTNLKLRILHFTNFSLSQPQVNVNDSRSKRKTQTHIYHTKSTEMDHHQQQIAYEKRPGEN